jgi:hypothetical protein
MLTAKFETIIAAKPLFLNMKVVASQCTTGMAIPVATVSI